MYVGFGSIVVDNPQDLTALIFEAVRLAGVRAIVCQGWSELGGLAAIPPYIFVVNDCPHDWLFKRVSCVVHHGGAGTTAAGLAAGRPTVVVPFFGDQLFWGNVVANAGAGPQPLPYKRLTANDLADAIIIALDSTVVTNASLLATRLNAEQGDKTAAHSFHHALPLDVMACSMDDQRAAVWQFRRRGSGVRLSSLAVTVLRKEGLLDFNELELYVASHHSCKISY